MRLFLMLLAALSALAASPLARAEAVLAPAEAAKLVEQGGALLIDVREPAEWSGGVVAGALLLPLSDLRGAREKWRPILEAHPEKTLVLYCRSGNRSGIAMKILREEGRDARNAGAFSAWQSAGVPITKP